MSRPLQFLSLWKSITSSQNFLVLFRVARRSCHRVWCQLFFLCAKLDLSFSSFEVYLAPFFLFCLLCSYFLAPSLSLSLHVPRNTQKLERGACEGLCESGQGLKKEKAEFSPRLESQSLSLRLMVLRCTFFIFFLFRRSSLNSWLASRGSDVLGTVNGL